MTTITKRDLEDLDEAEQFYAEMPDQMRDSEGWNQAFDLAVIQSILMDLAVHQPEMYAIGEKVRAQTQDRVRKATLKALAKRAKNGELTKRDFDLARSVAFYKHLPGQHDQSDHNPHKDEPEGPTSEEQAQNLQEDMAAVSNVEDATQFAFSLGTDWEPGEGQPVGVNPSQAAKNMFNMVGAGADKITDWSDKHSEGVEEALGHETWGRRVASGVTYLASQKNKDIEKKAEVLANFGLFTGQRMQRNYARYGGYDVHLPDRSEAEEGQPHKQSDRSEIEKFLKKRLPNREAHTLAGDRLPSEGFVISRDGEVKSRAVGRKNDHFMPFGLKHIKQMRKQEGGELIRSRSAGGLTVEDLHLGMMAGMDRVTVVSNNGTFSMAITDRAKGLRSEHFQILGQYQRALDLHGSRGSNKFDAYDDAMSAVRSQFPLHFKKEQSDRAQQSDSFSDIATPEMTLLDEFRSVFEGWNPITGKTNKNQMGEYADSFGNLRSRSNDKVFGQVTKNGDRTYSQDVFPNRSKNMTMEKWEEMMVRNGRQDRITRAYELLGYRDQEHRSARPATGNRARVITKPGGKSETWTGKPTHAKGQSGQQAMGNPPKNYEPERGVSGAGRPASEVVTTQTANAPTGQAKTQAMQELERQRQRVREEQEDDPHIITGTGIRGVDLGEEDRDRIFVDWEELGDDEKQAAMHSGYGPNDRISEGDLDRMRGMIDNAEDVDNYNPFYR